LSLIEIARLDEPQRRRLAEYGERWAGVRLATGASDRFAAEAAVARAYGAAGLAPPREIVWVGGPFEMASLWVATRDAAGDNVRPLIVDMVRRKSEAAIDRAIGLGVRTAVAEEPRLTRLPPFCATIDDAVYRACETVRAPLRQRLPALFSIPYRRSRLSFASSSFGFHSTASLGLLEYLHDVCGCERQTQMMSGLWELARNVAWILPHRNVCWLSERPNLIRHDVNGRLHAPKGPAIRYRDGWSAHAWKGVLVPGWIIERSELLNVRTIAAATDPQIRRCMIDIFTPERFVREGGAYRVAQDETGILWRQRWRWESWAAVEVLNGSPEPDGTYKRYFLQIPPNIRSPREAVAWTYGLTEQRYRPALRT
jgi:hypothetical protein